MMRRPPRSPLFPSAALFRSLAMGAVAGSELDALAAEADRNPPQLRAWDERGARIDEAVRHPAYVEMRSEEHTSELQSQSNLVCRLLLEKKKSKPHLPQCLTA